MSPITHFFLGWLTANTASLNRRERACVTVAGVIPDADGLGIVPEILTRHSSHPLTWWSDYHHVLGHNLGFCLAASIAGFALAKKRWTTAALVCVSFQLHLLCDLMGARGPEGHQWPIPYLLPFSNAWQLTWAGQWALNAWPNFVITGGAIALTLFLAWRRGYSPLEMFSRRADTVFVEALRKRFPAKSSASKIPPGSPKS
jgi:LexA-binding, inner membrane-associated putative hydrolase